MDDELKREIRDYITNNLVVRVDTKKDWDCNKEIVVSLELEGEVISKESFYLD